MMSKKLRRTLKSRKVLRKALSRYLILIILRKYKKEASCWSAKRKMRMRSRSLKSQSMKRKITKKGNKMFLHFLSTCKSKQNFRISHLMRLSSRNDKYCSMGVIIKRSYLLRRIKDSLYFSNLRID